MNTKISQPVRLSYQRHRKQLMWQIILPVVLASLLVIAAIVLINIATFRDGGDVARWTAVSTIWIVIPIMIGMLILLFILGGLVYLMAKLLNVTPTYTGQVQDLIYKIAGYAKRGADAVVKPVLGFEGVKASINAFFGRK